MGFLGQSSRGPSRAGWAVHEQLRAESFKTALLSDTKPLTLVRIDPVSRIGRGPSTVILSNTASARLWGAVNSSIDKASVRTPRSIFFYPEDSCASYSPCRSPSIRPPHRARLRTPLAHRLLPQEACLEMRVPQSFPSGPRHPPAMQPLLRLAPVCLDKPAPHSLLRPPAPHLAPSLPQQAVSLELPRRLLQLAYLVRSPQAQPPALPPQQEASLVVQLQPLPRLAIFLEATVPRPASHRRICLEVPVQGLQVAPARALSLLSRPIPVKHRIQTHQQLRQLPQLEVSLLRKEPLSSETRTPLLHLPRAPPQQRQP